MMRKDRVFMNVSDPGMLGRLSRSADITILNRFEFFEAVNSKNRHRYRVNVTERDITCSCPDSKKGNHCKHEIAVARDMSYFLGGV
ncbi:SWIM zinc finger-containing protein [Candidatus Methanoperedens nitroreducens]|uniref:SWIM zinc finger-containing protein n=1 Tax=Candidatus Methanoperedens nitratireducens TaxID=1392998 RepID=A0A062VAT0_9EURY|nr:SWIM zinc finger family protein [Candidatus Methanoperedens nitroreducens]KCZ73633.1 SWIM zinc finger-containing protein [Candidatus Methanoperedens nitroreducens]MDJ1422409.1 SWIM zinc finger family protein [Candidatus Methanoperedens sp.]